MKKINIMNILFFGISFFFLVISFFKEDVYGNIIFSFSIANYIKLFNFAFLKEFVINFLLTIIVSLIILVVSLIYVFKVLKIKKRKQFIYIAIPMLVYVINFFSLIKGYENFFVYNFLSTMFIWIFLTVPLGILICYYFFKNLKLDSYYTFLELTKNPIRSFFDTTYKIINKTLLTIFLYILNVTIYMYFVFNMLISNSYVVYSMNRDMHISFICAVLFIINFIYVLIWRFNNEKNC